MFGEASGSARFASKMEAAEAKKIESQLEKLVGLGNVVARVSIELDMQNVTIVDQDWDPDESGSLIKKEMHDEDSLNTRERALGDRGVGETQNDPQGGLPGSLNDLPIAQTEEERESKTTEYIADNTVTETVRKPGARNYITASVLINNQDMAGNPIDNNIEQLKKNIASTIGLRPDATGKGYTNGHVEIAEFAFYRPPALPAGFSDKWDQTMQEYEPLINALIGLLVAIVALVIFFKIMSRFRAEDQPEVEIIDDSENAETAALMDNPYQDDQSEVPALTDALTPELLNELIRERSGNVGSALREYMNKK
jgi:flagellar biosynthesis/type III secretory pathway M-ring protein FliF/YscJ